MLSSARSLAAATIVAVGLLSSTSLVSAAPSAPSMSASEVRSSTVEQIQFRGRGGGFRGGYRGGGRGFGWGGVGAGIVAGTILGGAFAAPYYYNRPYGGYGYYDAPGVYAAPGGDAVAYCSQRFRSYDPASGTYMGYDGFRHSCP